MEYILAFDQGTTSSRAILFDNQARIVQTAQKELEQHFPGNAQVEHDALAIWNDQLLVARQAISQAGISAQRIAAIGITNQRETTVVWDRKTGAPIARAIVWQDRRTASHCAELVSKGYETLIQKKTGLLLDPYFSATKLKWLLDHIPGARDRAQRGELAFGTIDSWLVWQLTGAQVHATDVSNASRTLLFNIHTLCWDEDLLDLFDIPAGILPEVCPSSGVVGYTEPSLFGRPIPIGSMIGDQQAAAVGQACWSPGMVKNTYGTGCFMLLNTGHEAVPSANRLITTVGWQMPQQDHATYCLEGSIFMAGATVQWLRDGLNLFSRTEDIEPLASSVNDTDDVFLVPALTGLGAPYWDSHARGTLVGMTRGTSKAHLARAALESIALQVTEVLQAMHSDSRSDITELRVDGGASRNNLLMQMQADFSGRPVLRPAVTETTALGAACMAGLATGVWPDTQTLATLWSTDRIFEPQWSDDQRQAHVARWRQAVERARDWAR